MSIKNIDTLIVDRAIRGTMFDKETGAVIFSASNITSPSLEVAGEQVFAVDAIGTRIATLDRSSTATFSAENTQISLGVMAAQFGAEKKVATSVKKIVGRKFEICEVGQTGGTVNETITLGAVPYGLAGSEIPFIYRLNPDQSLGTSYAIGAEESATKFSLAAATKVVTLPTPIGEEAIKATDRFAFFYESEMEDLIKISKDANKFALGGMFDLEVLFADICNPNIKYHGHIVFPNMKMNPGFTLAMTTEGTHSFGFEAMADYCSADRNLFYLTLSA